MLRRKEITTTIIIVSINNYMYIKNGFERVHQLSNLEEGEFYDQEAQKKFRALGENWTHGPPSSSLDALST